MAYDPDQTRLRIIKASAELFYGQSIAEVGVDAIAARAGTTKKTLYYHFDNKINLIKESFAYRANYVLDLYRHIIDSACTAEEAILTMFERTRAFAQLETTRGCPFVRGAAELAAKDDHPASIIIRHSKADIQRLIANKLLEEDFERPHQMARQVMIVYEGAITNVMFHDDPTFIDEAIIIVKSMISAAKQQ